MSSAAYAFPHKSAEAFRTISEVAIELDVPQHVLRFWESRFAQIKPVKRAGGRRYYRPDDIDLLKGIRALLYTDGLTEAPNEEDKEFSSARLADTVRSLQGQTAHAINDGILAAVQRFTGDTAQRDDFTLVTVNRV